MQVTLFVFILWIYQTEAYPWTSCCSDQCHYSWLTATVSCEGVKGAIPQCLPKDIEELFISNSPEFTLLGEYDLSGYERLKTLSIVKTGLTEIHGYAFKDLPDLTTIEIKYAPYFRKLPLGIFYDKSKLLTISIEFCQSLRILQHGTFKNLTNLQVLNLGSNAIQQVDEDMLHLSLNVRSIDLSNNKQLDELPRYVFSKLAKLRRLALSNCSLRVLYPEHVKTPCGSGSLSTFDGRHNLWQCDHMQEFIAWIKATPHFSDFARIGTCSTPELLQNQDVLSLPLHQRDSSRNNLRLALNLANTVVYTSSTPTTTSTSKANQAAQAKSSQTWTSIAVITIVVICLIIFLMAAKICSCSCRSSNASSQNRPSGAVMIAQPRPTRNYRNQGFDESEVPTQFPDETILQSHCNVGDWTINNIDPPSYEDVVGDGDRRQDMNKTPDTIAEIVETAPPPYDGAKDA